MKWRFIMLCSMGLIPLLAYTQPVGYEATDDHPFGSLNPAAPVELRDYQELIGNFDCLYLERKQDGSWADSIAMKWTFQYIMNGMAIQDIALKVDGRHATSIRQFLPDSSAWYVTYFAVQNPQPRLVWMGGKKQEDKIVLNRPHTVAAGEGISRLTFSNITPNSFHWEGAWVSMDGRIEYPFRKIRCRKIQ